MKVILHAYAITSRKDDISFRLENEVDPDSDFLEKNPVCLVRYRSKYTNRKTVDKGKASMRNSQTLRYKQDASPNKTAVFQ